MEIAFFVVSAVAIVATLLAIINFNPVHGLLYLIVSLLAVAVLFFMFGAPFAGILEVIVYAGAIMVLFVFVVMMLNLGPSTTEQERQWLKPAIWGAPAILCAVLLLELLWLISGGHALHPAAITTVDAKAVGIALYGPYLLAVELGSMLLLAALVAAFHIGRQQGGTR